MKTCSIPIGSFSCLSTMGVCCFHHFCIYKHFIVAFFSLRINAPLGVRASWVQCLPITHKALDLIPSSTYSKHDDTYLQSPRIRSLGDPWLSHDEFNMRLVYMRHGLKKWNNHDATLLKENSVPFRSDTPVTSSTWETET